MILTRRFTTTEAVVAVIAAAIVGVSVAQAAVVASVAAAVIVVIGIAVVRPQWALEACVLGSALHYGIFLYYRASVLGVPVNAFDGAPLLLLFAAVLIARGQQPTWPVSLSIAASFMVMGLLMGVIVGLAAQTESYEVLRVLRLHLGLLALIGATALAGRHVAWQKSLQRALYAAGVVVAVQIVVSYVWLVGTGTSLWSYFPFGHEIRDVPGAFAGNVGQLRVLELSPFVMLTTYARATLRMYPRDSLVVALVIGATALSLSRTAWLALLLTTSLVLLVRFVGNRQRLSLTLQLAAVLGIAVTITFATVGGIVNLRFNQTNQLVDESALFRKEETQVAVGTLTNSLGNATLGLGAGTIIEHPGLGKRAPDELSPLLENGWVALWVNGGLLLVTGVGVLLGAGSVRGWKRARRDSHDGLAAMSIALPALALSALVGGTFSTLVAAGPTWLLAGAILMGKPTTTGLRDSISSTE